MSLRWLTNDAVLGCPHPPGIAQPKAQQDWVTIEQTPVLIGDDPTGRTILSCPMYGIGITPCTTTKQLMPEGTSRRGHSRMVTVDGEPVCLETVEGITNGIPPLQLYDLKMSRAGQDFVRVST